MKNLLIHRNPRTPAASLRAVLLAVLIAFSAAWVAQPQQTGGTTTLKGETRTFFAVPDNTIDAGLIRLGEDSDHDGMPDDVEAANGTDPNDASDADGDLDGDGLSNLDEVALGSNLTSADSDGDGVSDLDEARLGYDPTDPANVPPATPTLLSLDVAPAAARIVINDVLGQQPVRLQVTGRLSDGSTIDLTRAAGTRYRSLDPSVALVDSLGTVVGADFGLTTIRVSNGGQTADMTIFVARFAPVGLSALPIPGYANNVDVWRDQAVAGDYAFVAAGAAGLVVVDVSDRLAPFIAATLDTPGNANDVRVSGGRAYVADGPAGLRIVDVSVPEHPVALGSVDTPGQAQDVAVRGSLAYVADGAAGLQVIDVSSETAPVLLGGSDTPGQAEGVDVSGNHALVADGFAGLQVIDVTNPALPAAAGSVLLAGEAKDVVARDAFAHVAAHGGGFLIVDWSAPEEPRVVGSSDVFIVPRDVELAGNFAATTDQRFLNAVPFVRVSDPANPRYSGVLDLFPLGDYVGTGIALDAAYVYLTGQRTFVTQDNGTTGDTRLFIGQYQLAGEDDAGVAPEVSLDAPQNGASILEGDNLQLSATASDDVRVAGVLFRINGTVVASDSQAPYELTYTVPAGAPALTVTATAFDLAGRSTTSAPALVEVLPSPPPSLTLVRPAEGEPLVEGRWIELFAEAGDDTRVTQVVFSVDGVPRQPLTFPPYFDSYFIPLGTTSLTLGVTATDSAGKTTTVSRTFRVDADPAPVVMLTNPPEGAELTEGQRALLTATAADNGSITQFFFTVAGEIQPPLYSVPYRQSIEVPTGVGSLAIEATATDDIGKTTTVSRTVSVVPDAGTMVAGRVADRFDQPVAGASVTLSGLAGFATQSGADGAFSFSGVPTVRGEIVARATAALEGRNVVNASAPAEPVPGGLTDLGTIRLSTAATAPVLLSVADYTGDFSADLFVGYPDRQSLIYQRDGEQLVPSASPELPFGAITSGAAPVFSSTPELYTQIAGHPGRVRHNLFDGGALQLPVDVATGLDRESRETALGLDTGVFANRKVLAFLGLDDAGGTLLRVRVARSSDGGGGSGGAVTGIAASTVAGSDEFGEPISLPVDPAVRLRSLQVADVTGDQLADVVAIWQLSGSDGRLLVFPRLSAETFGPAVETPVVVRSGPATRGMVDFLVGKTGSEACLYVLSDDRVRVYAGDGTGSFVQDEEIALPAGHVPTGIAGDDLNFDGVTDLLVTTADVAVPESKLLLVSLGAFDPGGQTAIQARTRAPEAYPYTAPVSAGDTRITAGNWGGGFDTDVVVVDGEAIRIVLDVEPLPRHD